MKKKMNLFLKIVIVITAVFILLFLLRGNIYQVAVKYEDVGGRKSYDIKDDAIKNYINENLPNDESLDATITIDQIIDISLDLTGESLSFVLNTKENDPQKIFVGGEANCVGYAAFTAAIGSYLIDRFGLGKEWEAKPKKGKLYLFGNNMQKNAQEGWFKDHDFVIFKNKNTKEEIYVDPVSYEYFGASRVNKYQK